MIIVGLDVETTGIGVGSEIVEIGWCVYDTEEDAPLAGGYELLLPERWSDAAQAVHKISPKMVRAGSIRASDLDLHARIAPYQPQAVVSHHAEFDHKFIRKHWPQFCNLPWICTIDDLNHGLVIENFRHRGYSKKIHLIASDYRIRFEQDDLHRAHTDAVLCCKIAARHLNQAAPNGLRDIALDKISAKISGKVYKDVVIKGPWIKDLDTEPFLEYGFRYESAFDKSWHKKIKDPFNNEQFMKWVEENVPKEWIVDPRAIRSEDLCSYGSVCTMRNIEV